MPSQAYEDMSDHELCLQGRRPLGAVDEYGLFNEIDLLSIESIVEEDRLLLFEDRIGSGSERQCGADQRLEEHCRCGLRLNCTTVFVRRRSRLSSQCEQHKSWVSMGVFLPLFLVRVLSPLKLQCRSTD